MDAQTELSNTTVRRKKCRKKIRQTENWLFFREVRAMRTLQRRWWGKLLNSSIVSGKHLIPPPSCCFTNFTLVTCHTVILPGYICCRNRAGSTLHHGQSRLDSTVHIVPTRIMQFFWVGFTVNKNLHTLVRESLPLHYKKI